MNKEDYIKIVDEKLSDSSKKIMIEQINKFYEGKSFGCPVKLPCG